MKAISEEKQKKMCELYEQGNSIADLMKMGFCHWTVKKYLKKFGITRNYSQAGKLAYKLGKINLSNSHQKGALNPNWKGGFTYHQNGYKKIRIPEHPKSNNGYVFEHIIVWEKTHNQSVPKGYVIHHLNGIKTDNRPENLIAMKRSEHINLAEPYKERIRELEEENKSLKEKLKPVIS